MKSKRYSYDWEMLDEKDTPIENLVTDILNDEELPELEEIRIGQFTVGYDDEENAQKIINGFIANKEKLQHISSFFIGDMSYDECEVSWITQGDYSNLWDAFPNLRHLTIKGSNDLKLGNISHQNLEELTLINGGLSSSVFAEIAKAQLPNLKKLEVYLGEDGYGGDVSIAHVHNFLNTVKFPSLTNLGIVNSDIQDDIAEAVLTSPLINQLTDFNLSYGVLADKGAQHLLEHIGNLPNLKNIFIEHHYVSPEMQDKVVTFGKEHNITVEFNDHNEPDTYGEGDDYEEYYNIFLSE